MASRRLRASWLAGHGHRGLSRIPGQTCCVTPALACEVQPLAAVASRYDTTWAFWRAVAQLTALACLPFPASYRLYDTWSCAQLPSWLREGQDYWTSQSLLCPCKTGMARSDMMDVNVYTCNGKLIKPLRVLSHVPKQFLSGSSSLSLKKAWSGTGLQRVAAGMADTQLSAQLEAHYQQYDVVSKQACARLASVWDMLELSAEEQSAELSKAAQKSLEVWAAACTDADRRVDAVRSSIEDMRREVQKTRDALKLGEARQLQLTSMGSKLHIKMSLRDLLKDHTSRQPVKAVWWVCRTTLPH